MSRTHEQNLYCIRRNLDRASDDAAHRMTEWNLGRVARLTEALRDYKRFMEGEIQRHQMCHTAQELTMTMPEWGTRGT
jgi:hypothetical protein